jgi:hypothetical protein
VIRVKITDTISPKLRSKKLEDYIYREWVKETRNKKLLAQQLAPKNKLKLARAIYGRTYKEPLKAVIGIPPVLGHSGFNYAEFVTGKLPIKIEKENPYFAVGQTIYYGSPAVSPAGNPINWSATIGWWGYFEEQATQGFKNATRRGRNAYVKAMNS